MSLLARVRAALLTRVSVSRRDVFATTLGVFMGLCLIILLTSLSLALVPVPKASVIVKTAPSPSPSPNPSPKAQKPAHVIGEDRVVSLWTRDTLGHACPISPVDALTADHVAVSREILWGPNGGFAPFVVWGDQLGNVGTAQWQWSDKRRDLSLLRIVPGTRTFSAYLRRAASAPRVGDVVYVVGFKFGKGAGDWTNEAKVSGIQAGVIVYETTPGSGSSGSCVLNAAGEFVAINVWTLAGEGVGMLVVGEWAEVPDMFLDGAR